MLEGLKYSISNYTVVPDPITNIDVGVFNGGEAGNHHCVCCLWCAYH